MLQQHQQEFFDLAVAAGALCFGEFRLKSGRISPYFFNAGLFNTGDHLARLGACYATAIVGSGLNFDLVFGPAYKGIPLAVATCIALRQHHGQDFPWAFDRKELKDHGEGGRTVGAPVAGRVLIIDDVISSGLSISQAATLIAGEGAELTGVCVALDRQERGDGALSARQEIEEQKAIKVLAIASLDQMLEYLQHKSGYEGQVPAVQAYRRQYGV